MVNEIKTWLKDIEQAIAEINSFIPNIKNFKDFQKDLKTKRAVERNIEIIGEAMSRILKVEPNIKISNTRRLSIRETELLMDMIPFQKTYFGES